MAQEKRPRGNPNWVKGCPSPNPTGRPSDYAEFRKACQARTPEALAALTDALTGGDSQAVAAARVLLEYGWGKPAAAPEDREAQQGMVAQVSAALDARSTEELVAFYAVLTAQAPK